MFNLPGFESNWFYLTCGDTPPPSGVSGSLAAVPAPATRWRQIPADRSLQPFELHAGEKLQEGDLPENRQGSCFLNLK